MRRRRGNVSLSARVRGLGLLVALAAVGAFAYGCTAGTSRCLNPPPLPPFCGGGSEALPPVVVNPEETDSGSEQASSGSSSGSTFGGAGPSDAGPGANLG